MTRFIVWLASARLLTALTLASETNNVSRPAQWAQPIPLPGITNSYRVTTNLFRGSQPSAEGMRALQALGIRSVINLRAFHSDESKVAGTGMKLFAIKTNPWNGETEDVVAFLKILRDTNNLPAYVHCQRGADRTGTMCATYRIVGCGWSKAEAIAELREGGFHFSPVWRNLVKFIEHADFAKIGQAAGWSDGEAVKTKKRGG